jgi:beta-mannosidase
MQYSNYNLFTMALLILTFLSACNNKVQKELPVEIEINSNWEFSQAGTGNWMPTTVPGTVHNDLLNNGVIDDPHYRMNENEVQWVEDEDWEYRTTFDVTDEMLAHNNIILDFKGLDTYAMVMLNGKEILNADNMFVNWEVNVKDKLQKGANQLNMHFNSPVKEGMKKLTKLDYIVPAVNEQAPVGKRTNVFTRKAPFHYGWDWGPRLVTSGIWRPVILKAWDNAVVELVYVSTKSIKNELALLNGHIDVNVSSKGTYSLSLLIDGKSEKLVEQVKLAVGENRVAFDFEIPEPRLWWSNGLGEPYLYDFKFQLKKENVIVDEYQFDFGVRTLELVQEPDSVGHSFYFELNGVPVFMKGANVIPSETLTPSVDNATYNRLIDDAVTANMNMLRVWGGAIYEEELFYSLCDQNGILVWQDFMFACAVQPGDVAHLDNIKKEAEYNVKRLRNHPSIALWCGDNENYHGWHEWWVDLFEPEVEKYLKETYSRISTEILADAVKEHAPHIDYWPSSPMAYGHKKADRKSGDEHDWTIWFGQKPFSAYEENVPRFVSEYGLQSFPDMHTIKKFSEPQDWDIDSPVMRHRQRSKMEYVAPGFDGNDMIKWYMKKYYNVPGDFEKFVYVSQLLQAKAYKTAIEAHRRNMPHCMGSLYWQLNDSWPTISWSTIDYYGRWKASHYAVKKANNPVLVSPDLDEDMLKVYVVSDKLSEIANAKLEISLVRFNGEKLQLEEKNINIPANTSILVFEKNVGDWIKGVDLNESFILTRVLTEEKQLSENHVYFQEPKNLKLQKANVQFENEKTGNGYKIKLTTDYLAKNLYLRFDNPDVKVSDNYFDLVPGEEKVVEVYTDEEIDFDEGMSFLMLNYLIN